VFVAFAMTTMAGEFGYLTQAGFTLQGRYFLPAVLGLIAPVLWHRVTPARYALLAGLVAVNLLLAQRTVTRYYEEGWTGVCQALPFS
jgi:Flp pilus assembly pilin Flp